MTILKAGAVVLYVWAGMEAIRGLFFGRTESFLRFLVLALTGTTLYGIYLVA